MGGDLPYRPRVIWPSVPIRAPLTAVVLTAALLLAGCGGGVIRDGAAPAPAPWQAAARAGDPTWLSWHRDLLETVAHSRPEVVFLGDSITFAWTTTGLDTWRSDFNRYDPLDLGLPGDTTQNVLWRIDHGELSGIRPRAVVVMIGTNNLAAAGPADVARGIEAVVDDVRSHQPHAAVLLLGVLPIGTPASPLHVKPPAVDALLARHPFGAGVRLLDLSSSFTYRDGRLRPDLYHRVCLAGTTYCDTLVHPSAAGYAVMGRRILPVLSSMIG